MKISAKWFFILVVVLLLIMIRLGFWQLQRYHEKQQLLTQYNSQIKAPVLFWQDFLLKQQNFRRVSVTGYYLNDKTLLLDNRWRNSRLGYEVLTPFRVANQETVVLVNRGWIAAPRSRQQLPEIQVITGKQRITAYAFKPGKTGFMIGQNIEPGKQWPLRIQQIKMSDISHVTQLQFYPYELRLLPNDNNKLVREWQLVNITPARHLAYAIQWFLMSLTLIVVYSIFLWRKGAR